MHFTFNSFLLQQYFKRTKHKFLNSTLNFLKFVAPQPDFYSMFLYDAMLVFAEYGLGVNRGNGEAIFEAARGAYIAGKVYWYHLNVFFKILIIEHKKILNLVSLPIHFYHHRWSDRSHIPEQRLRPYS